MLNRALSLALSGIGLVVALYLSAVHLSPARVTLACSVSGLVNCEQVTTSAQSMVGPLPVAYLGVVWFAALLGLLAWRDPRAPLARLAWAAAGLAFVLYLVYAELFLIGAICLWCTAVHALVIVLFLLALDACLAPAPPRPAAEPSPLR